MSALAQSRPMTPEEFLVWESEQPGRHEFIHGEIYAMTGGTLAHTEISLNLVSALRSRLKPHCRVYHADIKIQVEAEFFYPDVLVQCSPRDPSSQLLSHPVLLAEVLSPSTEKYDQVVKWPRYQRLSSLQTFLLVSQHAVEVQLYRRRGAEWSYTLHTDPDDVLELSEPALMIPVRELYAGIDGLDPAVPLAT
jgi:Uma2 family endonuclease